MAARGVQRRRSRSSSPSGIQPAPDSRHPGRTQPDGLVWPVAWHRNGGPGEPTRRHGMEVRRGVRPASQANVSLITVLNQTSISLKFRVVADAAALGWPWVAYIFLVAASYSYTADSQVAVPGDVALPRVIGV